MLRHLMCNCQRPLESPIMAPNNINPSVSSLHHHQERNQDRKAGHPHWSQERERKQEGSRRGHRAGVLPERRQKTQPWLRQNPACGGLPLLPGFPLRRRRCNALHAGCLRDPQNICTQFLGEKTKTSESNSEFPTAQLAIKAGTQGYCC